MWLQVSAGRGPLECQLGVGLFTQKFLLPFIKKKKVQATVIKENPGGKNGTFFSVLISIDSEEHAEMETELKALEGSIKWICPSPYRPKHKRKNWFINLELFESPEEFGFDLKDVEFSSTRSGGPGGQNVNKVETAVRAVHLPSKVTVLASEERSQAQNKKLALARLHKILKGQFESNQEIAQKELWNQHNQLVRGEAIMTFKGLSFKKVE